MVQTTHWTKDIVPHLAEVQTTEIPQSRLIHEKMAPITLYFLQASRSIRTAWVLEELGLEYDVVFADRENGKAPQWLKDQAGGLGKLPALKDGDLMLYESGNITEYADPPIPNPTRTFS